MLKLDFDNCAIPYGEGSEMVTTELVEQALCHENDILKNDKIASQSSNLFFDSLKISATDSSDCDNRENFFGFKILPLDVTNPKSINELSSNVTNSKIKKFNIEAELHVTESLTIDKTGIQQRKEQSILSEHNCSSLLQSPNSEIDSNQVMTQTSSFSSIDTVLKKPCNLEARRFLPSKRIKRKKLIFCCVG